MTNEELIHKILHKKATVDELSRFNELYKSDTDFKSAFDDAKDIKAALTSKKKEDLKRMFQSIQADDSQTRNKMLFSGKLRYLIPLAAAASVALFIWLNIFNTSNEDLYNTYFEPYRNVVTSIERGKEIETNDLLSRAFYSYESKDYNTAIASLKKLYQQDEQSYYLFYLGVSQLANDDVLNAISTLQKHQDTQDDFYARSRWYLALAYLKAERNDEAKEILEEIVEVESFNYEKAIELTKKLN